MVVKHKKEKIAIFHNLKKGGALILLNNITHFIKKKYKINIFTIKNKKFHNFLDYLIYVYFKLPKIHKNIACEINNNKYKKIIINHDYLTKSPYILKYIKNKKIYLVHEEPREFYQGKKYFNTNIKNKIINIIRYPLKHIDKYNLKHADVLLTNSKFSKNKLEKIYDKKFKVLNLGIDKTKFNFCEKKEKYFITIGSTSFFKGIDFIIKSISKLPKKYKYKLIIIGDKGRDHKRIIHIAKSNKIKIKQYNRVSNKKLKKMLQKASLYLAAGINEPFGLSILEAISCGTKVIATNEGGYKEILENNNEVGSLVKRDVDKFCKEIIKQINTKMLKKSRNKFISKWDIKNTINQLKSFL